MDDEKKEALSADAENGEDRASEVDAAAPVSEPEAAEAAVNVAEAADTDQAAADETAAEPEAPKAAPAKTAKGKKPASTAKKKAAQPQ